jgi:hypothetical protein
VRRLDDFNLAALAVRGGTKSAWAPPLVIAVTVGWPDRNVYPGLIEHWPSAWITWFVDGCTGR